MDNYLTVNDYMADVGLSQEAFLQRYAHPFLVIVGSMKEDDNSNDASFLTQAYISLDNKSALLGGGPALSPNAVVLPVKKRKVTSSARSPLASTVMVGRNEDNDLVITATGVSKYHFYIALQPFSTDEYTVSDNGSTNGTFVNFKKVQPPSRCPIKSGDRITLGQNLSLRFYLASAFWENLQKNL